MEDLTYEAVTRFVAQYAKVEVVDAEGSTKRIADDPDSIDLVKNATNFKWNDQWFTRKEFRELLREKLRP